jgi:hypothetical protein
LQSFGSAGAGPTAMSGAARRQTTASLFSDTSPRCHRKRLVAIGRTAYFRFVVAYGHTSAPSARSNTSDAAYDLCMPPMKLVLVLACALPASAAAEAALRAPVLMTVDGVSGARPGMSVDAVSERWGMRLRPSYEVRPTCGQAFIDRPGIKGYAIFMPRGRFGAVFLRRGAVTGRGIRVGATLAQLTRAYPILGSRPDRYIHGGRQYFFRRKRSPHWQLRFDVSPRKRVTQIAFGEHVSVRLDEGCA